MYRFKSSVSSSFKHGGVKGVKCDLWSRTSRVQTDVNDT